MLLTLATPWTQAIPAMLISGIVTLVLVPVSMAVGRRVGAVAMPDASRKLHSKPTPQIGGVAIALGFLASLAVFHSSISHLAAIAGCLAAIVAVMVIDDIRDLAWWQKLIPELGIAVILALAGVSITFIALPGGAHGAHIIYLGILAVPVTVVWIVGMQNSINLLDGSDGVAAGVVAIVAFVCGAAAVIRPGGASTETGVIVMAGALFGACVCFLVFNLPPAQVFMGDSGSHFLGTTLAILTILAVAKLAVTLSLLVPLIALGLPIGDTAAAIIRRKWNGKGILEPDAGHLHHRLRALGLSKMETALIFYLTTAILGCFSLLIVGHEAVIELAVLVLGAALAVIWGRLFLRMRRDSEPSDVIIEVEGHKDETNRERKRKFHSGEGEE